MNYAIMRCVKLNTMGAVAASLQHCFRERETLNADPKRTPSNEHLSSKSTTEAMGKLRDLLPEKRRKDAVLVVEYVLTASPPWWAQASDENQLDFVTESMRWINAKYGAQNVITMTLHRDELTPHLSVFVVPKTLDGRLSAKTFIGNKTQMSQDQTSFARAVTHLGLQRGLEGSRATHQRVKSHYGALSAFNEVKLPELTLEDIKPAKIHEKLADKLFQVVGLPTLETPQTHLERLNQKIIADITPMRESALKSLSERHSHERMRKVQQELISERQQLGLHRLPSSQLGLVAEFVNKLVQDNELRRSQEQALKRAKSKSRSR